MPKKAVCAEIGAWKGDFTKLILQKTQPEKIYIIDPYKYVESYEAAWYGGVSGSQEKMDEVFKSVQIRFENELHSGQLEIVRDDSTQALDQFENESLDWVYIDGNHMYEYVKQDLEKSLLKVKNGGYITGDDYNLVGWWEDGVTKAVDEFVNNRSSEIELVSIKGTQFILRKR